jgi:hypothetical protein
MDRAGLETVAAGLRVVGHGRSSRIWKPLLACGGDAGHVTPITPENAPLEKLRPAGR